MLKFSTTTLKDRLYGLAFLRFYMLLMLWSFMNTAPGTGCTMISSEKLRLHGRYEHNNKQHMDDELAFGESSLTGEARNGEMEFIHAKCSVQTNVFICK